MYILMQRGDRAISSYLGDMIFYKYATTTRGQQHAICCKRASDVTDRIIAIYPTKERTLEVYSELMNAIESGQYLFRMPVK